MFEDIPDKERIALAKAKMEKALGHFVYLIALHETNAFVIYSDTLSSQVPRSYAANAFNLFREAMHQIEIVRLCALWDRPGRDRDSIPTVVELIDRDTIINTLAEEVRQIHANAKPANISPADDPDDRVFQEQAAQEINERYAKERAALAKAELTEAIKEAKAIADSERLKAVRALRDNQLAHVLSIKGDDQEEEAQPAKYHDETKLLETSMPVVERLYCWVSMTGFSLEESREIYRGHSQALWSACRFEIKR